MKDITYFFGDLFQIPDPSISLPVQLLSAGQIRTADTSEIKLFAPETYFLLYTVSGNARLHADKHFYNLSAQHNNLLFIDGNTHASLVPAASAWEYQIFHFSGDIFLPLLSLSSEKWGFLFQTAACSDLAGSLEKLAFYSKSPSIHSALKISGLLFQIITDCISESFSYPPIFSQSVPDYLLQMRELFDTRYEDAYTLDALASHFHINKYKLCREFHSYFGCSPIQYLNKQRISASKNLLLDPTCKVYEAGCKVGIDNTNHYISLFKKYVGCTPMQFRKNSIFPK